MRKRTGRTVGKCIIERRMEEARCLLAGSDDSIEQIAARCGYTEASAFTRRFHSVHGVSPGAWRQRAGEAERRG